MLGTKLIKAATGASGGAGLYVEDVFSTWLYTGNGSTQTITNGIDLAGEGGLVWIKSRNNVINNALFDTVRGAGKPLISDATGAEGTGFGQSFTSSGFSLTNGGIYYNSNGYTYTSWSFRKAPKFFDVVTYTGDANSTKTISHNLGSVPGCIIVKGTNAVTDWPVYHRSLNGGTTPEQWYLSLNRTDAQGNGVANWGNTAPTSTTFTVGGNNNTNGTTYVAYLFAHDAGGFGDGGTESVIKCGSFTTDGSGNFSPVDLGWEPQWILTKRTDSTQAWYLWDSMRGMSLTSGSTLSPNNSDAEVVMGGTSYLYPTATGFAGSGNFYGPNATVAYIAIRRGPMKTPTDATTVFEPVSATLNTTTAPTISTGNVAVTDALFTADRNTAGAYRTWQARITNGNWLNSASTGAETSSTYTDWDFIGKTKPYNYNDGTQITYNFRRAPGFFDVVAYTGDGTNSRSLTHNLGVTPELVFVKRRDAAANWYVGDPSLAKYMYLNDSLGWIDDNGTYKVWGTAPWASSTAITLPASLPDILNVSSGKYIAYLFASCPGVSKVGSYTGTGTTLNVDCGFASGARFVLIKRTDSTGDWYVWDTARGIVSGNDPYLLLNSTAAEVTSTDYIDPLSSGFQISSTAPAAINANGASYIYLAIA